ncbi:MAG TPA: hypothetical protein VHG71_11045 [Verrucomicrobiae bacterium]|nr:hypothetical protein [Verrucomicrobiae bacterium]
MKNINGLTKFNLLAGMIVFAWFVSGCAAGISRTGYILPNHDTTNSVTQRFVAIKCQAQLDTNDVVWLGSIHDYDTGFSTDCDEVAILSIFVHDANLIGADIINITEESQANIWTSSCYRAKADFYRYKDRDKAKNLVSDPKYAPQLVVERSAKYSKRTRDVLIGAAAGGLVGFVVVAAATDPDVHTNYPTSTPQRGVHNR